jgi:hypothetical protein
LFRRKLAGRGGAGRPVRAGAAAGDVQRQLFPAEHAAVARNSGVALTATVFLLGNEMAVPPLASMSGRASVESAMSDHPRSDDYSEQLPYSNANSRIVIQTQFGKQLKACYEVPYELPPKMLALLWQIYASPEASI